MDDGEVITDIATRYRSLIDLWGAARAAALA
jgi:myo-inositol catabolism protein IolC